jgi:lipopolysaccharide/colanic/teichoic acid biosynthesis glycosyltransferase
MKSYTPEQRAIILSMRPGMTDYAAIIFRDESKLLSSCENPMEVYRREIMPIKFCHYARYAREMGLVTDIRIILATISLLVFRRIPGILGIDQAEPASSAAARPS